MLINTNLHKQSYEVPKLHTVIESLSKQIAHLTSVLHSGNTPGMGQMIVFTYLPMLRPTSKLYSHWAKKKNQHDEHVSK